MINTIIRHIDDIDLAKHYENETDNLLSLLPNQFVITSNKTKLRYKKNQFVEIRNKSIQGSYIGKVHAKNDEQELALNILLDDEVKCVVLIGKAGCGKTFLTAQVALNKVEFNKYDKIFFTRNHVEVGKPLGALPGDMFEKIKPYCASIVDQIGGWSSLYHLTEQNTIEVEAISYLQGRDIKNCFIVVDEAQNINKDQIKMLLTRVGEGSKIVLCGDLQQVATKEFTNGNNGLEHLINSFNGKSDLFAMLELQDSVRSELAKLAAELL